MSKITFRADDDLIERLEALDASKSEAMREALRQYLDTAGSRDDGGGSDEGSIDALVAERVDELLDERLSRRAPRESEGGRDVNVNVTVEGAGDASARERTADRSGTADEERARPPIEDRQTTADTSQESESCTQCGESLDAGHVYCPNCGEKAVHRIFCDCGDELRSDWAFCPGCGRRTPSADVLDTA